MQTRTLRAWPLALLAGLLPLLGTLIAYPLSVHLGLVEACNPFIDGCTSISRAARHGLPNHLFRALLLPAAALQALVWLLCSVWLSGDAAEASHPSRSLRLLPWIGLSAACFLVLYGSFLGTEGDVYRWLRRYGIVGYFGGTCLAMLFSTRALLQSRWQRHALVRVLLALCVALPLLGLVNSLAPLLHRAAALHALQNATEWWAGLVFTLFFFVLAGLWHAADFGLGAARVKTTPPP
jgi:hypothetical protein